MVLEVVGDVNEGLVEDLVQDLDLLRCCIESLHIESRDLGASCRIRARVDLEKPHILVVELELVPSLLGLLLSAMVTNSDNLLLSLLHDLFEV